MALVAAAILAAMLLLRGLVPADKPAPAAAEVDDGAGTVASAPVHHPRRRAAPVARRPGSREYTSPSASVRFVETASEPENIPVSGTLLDDFSRWSSIPPGYFADGVTVVNGAVTLAEAESTSAPRSGVLESPPLPLRQPALAAPTDPVMEIPAGTEVSVQISFSEDGHSWTPWKQVQRFQKPDGKRITPPMQASLASDDWKSADSQTSETASGPAIRYRLELWSGGAPAPAVTDLRIWKREFH